MKDQDLDNEKEVAKLKRLELELIDLIAKSENEVLMNKFLEWQKQRNECNASCNTIIDQILSKQTKR